MDKYAAYQMNPNKLKPYEVNLAMRDLEQTGEPFTDYYVNGKQWKDRLELRQKRRDKTKEADMVKKSALFRVCRFVENINKILKNK